MPTPDERTAAMDALIADSADMIDVPASADALGEESVAQAIHELSDDSKIPWNRLTPGGKAFYKLQARQWLTIRSALSAMSPAGEVERMTERLIEVRGKNASNFDRKGSIWEAYDRAVLDCIAAIREPKP